MFEASEYSRCLGELVLSCRMKRRGLFVVMRWRPGVKFKLIAIKLPYETTDHSTFESGLSDVLVKPQFLRFIFKSLTHHGQGTDRKQLSVFMVLDGCLLGERQFAAGNLHNPRHR